MYIIRNVKIVVEKIVIKVHQIKELYKQLLEDIIFLNVKIV